MTDPMPGVVVSMTQIYAELQALHGEVRDMRGDVRDIADHESRLRALERKLWLASGAAIILGAVLGAVLTTVLRAVAGVP